jgi:Ca2+-binding EF-hand superfamily protein
VTSNLNNLEVYLRDIFDAYDEKKFGKIQLTHMVEALKKCDKIKLTNAQIYVLENIVPKDSKNEINYIEISKLLAEIIKKFYICSKKRK